MGWAVVQANPAPEAPVIGAFGNGDSQSHNALLIALISILRIWSFSE